MCVSGGNRRLVFTGLAVVDTMTTDFRVEAVEERPDTARRRSSTWIRAADSPTTRLPAYRRRMASVVSEGPTGQWLPA